MPIYATVIVGQIEGKKQVIAQNIKNSYNKFYAMGEEIDKFVKLHPEAIYTILCEEVPLLTAMSWLEKEGVPVRHPHSIELEKTMLQKIINTRHGDARSCDEDEVIVALEETIERIANILHLDFEEENENDF